MTYFKPALCGTAIGMIVVSTAIYGDVPLHLTCLIIVLSFLYAVLSLIKVVPENKGVEAALPPPISAADVVGAFDALNSGLNTHVQSAHSKCSVSDC
jgi:uncharacterized membrane protein